MVKRAKLSAAFRKATDPSLRTDNWGYVMDVVDLVKSGKGFGFGEHDEYDGNEEYDFYNVHTANNSENIMALISQNLMQENANVILRTLTLIIALSENCGSRIRVALSSKNFTTNVLYEKLISNSDVHITTRKETAKTVEKLSEIFSSDPSLKNMSDLYKKIQKKHPYLIESSKVVTSKNGPNVPQKTETHEGKKNADYDEEKMLEEALKLSLQEYEQTSKTPEATDTVVAHKRRSDVNSQNEQIQQADQRQQQPPAINKVRALYDLQSSEEDELSFKKGDIIRVIEPVYKDWWRGSLNGKIGIFPVNYVVAIPEKTEQEKLREQKEEKFILDKKQKVDSLQAVLAENKHNSPDTILQNEEITQLYGEVTPLRPGLTRMIGKYAYKKEELLRLNKVLNDSEKLYSSMMHQATSIYMNPPQQQQQQQQQQPQIPGAHPVPFSGYAQAGGNMQQQQSQPGHGIPAMHNAQRQFAPQDVYPNSSTPYPITPQQTQNLLQQHQPQQPQQYPFSRGDFGAQYQNYQQPYR